jgi:hypothetical protein
MKTYSTAGMSYCKRTKTIVCEASDFGPLRERINNPIWDRIPFFGKDGLTLKSHKTGAEIVFLLDRAVIDDDEIVCWEFKTPSGDLNLTILND